MTLRGSIVYRSDIRSRLRDTAEVCIYVFNRINGKSLDLKINKEVFDTLDDMYHAVYPRPYNSSSYSPIYFSPAERGKARILYFKELIEKERGMIEKQRNRLTTVPAEMLKKFISQTEKGPGWYKFRSDYGLTRMTIPRLVKDFEPPTTNYSKLETGYKIYSKDSFLYVFPSFDEAQAFFIKEFEIAEKCFERRINWDIERRESRIRNYEKIWKSMTC